MTSDENPRLRILYKCIVINGSPETILFGHMFKNTGSRKTNGRKTEERTEAVITEVN